MKLEDFKTFSEGYVEVKNLHGTSSKGCTQCGTWIVHWEKLTSNAADRCSVIGCIEESKQLHGGHVKKCESDDTAHYIVPLCPYHNNHKNVDCFRVHKTHLVSAVMCN